MKKSKIEDKFIEELERVPNISIACEKVGLSRQTIYRWMKFDEKFRAKVDQAITVGVDSICDLAESKLISNINSGSQRAIEFYLISNKKQYYRPKKPMSAEENKFTPVTKIEMMVVDNDGKPMTLHEYKKYEKENDW
jgi:hypothetical protein